MDAKRINSLDKAPSGKTFLGPKKEKVFKTAYAGEAKKYGLHPNPDLKAHHYDYRGAFKAGETRDASGHTSSKYKMEGHERTNVNGIHTPTGKKATPEQIKKYGNIKER